MTFRVKLLLAQAPFAAALLLLGLVAARSVARLGENAELILKDNYRSVLAAERMKSLADRLDRGALAFTLQRPMEKGGAAELRAQFESELRVQEANITEPGEAEVTRTLRTHWTAYRAVLDRLRAAPPSAREPLYFSEVLPALEAVDRSTQEILEINQGAMVAKSDRAQRQAHRVNALIVSLAVAVLVVGIFTASVLTVRLIRPLSILSLSVRRLGEGDLEARARIDGRDEIAALAREFNTMADKLGQYRRSSLGELLQAQQASQAAIDSLPDPVVVLDPGGKLLNVNRAAEDLLRVSVGGAEDPLRLMDPAVREVLDKVRGHVAGGRGAYVPRGFEEAVRTSSSEGDRYLLPRATPLYSEQGSIAGATIVLQDVTRLMRFDELKNDLVATVAHEFRTPLTSMRMAIHLLAEEVVGPLTEKQSDLVFAARQDCERLQSIVDDLLDLSRIQAGRVELQRGAISSSSLLSEAAAAARAEAEAVGLDLAAVLPEPDTDVDGDRERLLLVLSNLIANAVRHTPASGRIVLETSADSEMVRFQVADTGVGIPREYQERIFEKYFQVPGARAGRVGLGLYISREIVRAHGGEMGVESEPGRGSRFWFTVPRVKEASAAA
jgi:two-component system, NtrC family, sensor histidine kinase KinB